MKLAKMNYGVPILWFAANEKRNWRVLAQYPLLAARLMVQGANLFFGLFQGQVVRVVGPGIPPEPFNAVDRVQWPNAWPH
ncbi:MAG: hypothetical protein AB7N80_04375 [Bdellovibrionales bacterium]